MNGKIWKIVVMLAFVILLLSACNAIRGSRDLVTESRDVSNFNSVSLSRSGDVIIIQNGEESLTIETDDNIMQYITSEVRGETLYLGVEDSTAISPSRLVFTVGVDDLAGLGVSGSGVIEADSIVTDSLDVNVNGSGRIEISGLSADQNIDLSGSGKYEGGDLRSEMASVTVNGSGKATVWVTESLDAQINGSGSIDYYGSPQVSSTGSGSGDLNNKGDK